MHNTIMRKHQKNPNRGTFYKIINLYTSGWQGHKRQRKAEGLFRDKTTKCNAQPWVGLGLGREIALKGIIGKK